MSIVAHIIAEGEQANLSHVLTGFTEDDLTVEPETDSPFTDAQTLEVRTSEGEVLTQFHEACTEHDIRLDIRRIRHEPASTERLAVVGDSEDLLAR